jgi:hypothetical protein
MSKLNRGTKILLPGTTGKDVLGYRGRLEEVYSQQGLSVTEGNDLVRQIWITGTSKNQPEESFSIKDLRMVTPIEELVTNKAFGGLVQRFMNGGEPKDAYVFDFDDTLATTEAKTFQDMNDPSLIQKAVATRYASLAKRRASLGDDIHVLTSRYGSDKILSAIRDFMGQNGIEAKSVIGVAGMFQDEREPGKRPGTTRKLSTASKKAKILTDLAARYGRVTFLDDDQENLLKASEIEGVRAVEAEREKLFKKRALGGLVQKFLEGGVAKKPTFGTGETKFPRRITNAYVREMEKQQNDLLLRKSIEQSKRRDQFIPGERVNIGEEEFGMISESMQKPFDLEAYKNTFEKRISRSEFFDRIGQFAQFIGLPQEDLGLVLPQFVDFGRIKGAGLFNRTGLSEKDLKKDAKHLDLSQHGYGEKEEQDLFGYTKLLEEKKKEVNKIIKTPTRTFEDGSFSYDYEAAEKVRKEIDDINNKIFSLEDKKAAAIAAAREAIKSKASATGRGSVGLSFGEFLADDVQQNVLYHEFTHQLINGLRTRSAESFDKYKERVSSLFSGDNDDLSDAFDSLGSYYNSADIVYGRSYKKGFLDSAIVRKGREKENAEFRGWSNIGGTPPPGTKEKDIPLSKEEYDNIQNIFTSLAKYSVEAEDAKTATQFRPLNPDINSLLLSTGYYDQSAIDRVEDIGKEEFLTTLMQKYPVLNQELQKALDGTLTELLGSAGVSRQKYAAGGLIQKFARGGSSYSRRPSKLVPQEKGMLSPSPFDVSQSKTDYYSLLDQYPELSKEFDSLAYFAKSADFNLQEFERYLQQRIQYKQQYANIRTNVSNLADQLKAPERFANGGTVPAMVSNGEAFVPPQVAKQIGYGKLNKMNQADRNGMSGFAGGGISIFKGPGSGTSDSIGPIGLPVGSFIIREKATKALGLNKGGAIGVVQRFADGSEGGVDSKGLSIVSMVLQKMAEDAEASVGQMARQVARAFDDVKGSGDLLAEDAESFLNEFAKAVEQVTGREFKVGGESINNLNPKQQVAAATRIREYVGTVGRDADRTAQQEREKETGRQKEVSSARDFKVSEGSASQIQQIIDEQKNRLITAFSKTGVSAEFIAGKVTEFNIVLGKLGEVTKDTNISELIQEMHAFQDATDGIDLTAAQQAAAKVVELIEPLTKLDVSAGEAKRKEEKRGFTGVEFGSLQEITAYFNELEGAFDIGAVLTIPETLAKIDAEIAAAERDLSTTLKGAFSGAAGTAAERKAVADASPEVQAAKTRVEELKSSRVSRVTAVGTEAGVETDVTVALIDYADRINSVSKEIEAAAREASKASKMEELALKRQKKVKLQAIKVAMSGITEGTYQERFAQAKAEVESGDPSSSAFHDLLEMQPAMDAAAQAVEEASLNSVVAAERLRQLEEERVRLAGETAGLAAGGAGSVALGIVGTDEGRAQAQKDYERANLRQQALAAGEQRAKIATGGQLPGENDEDYTKRYQENLMAQTRRSAKELGLVRTKVLSPREAEAQQKNETQTEEKKAKESASIQSRVQNLLIQAINKNTNALLGNEEETKSLQEEVSNLASKQEEMSREAESADKTTTDTFDINDAFKDDTYTITALDVLDDFGNMMNQKADAIAASFTDINGETSKAGKAIQSLGETIAAGSIGVKEGLRTVNESFINSKVGGVFKGLSSIGGLITGFIGTAGLQSAADAVGGYDTGLGGSLMVSADILSSATAFATAGSALGPLGTAAGAAVGAIKGLVDGIEAWQEAAEKARFAELEDLATRKAAMASQDFGVFFDSIEPDFEDFASGVRNLAETINAENEMIRSGQGPGEATKSTLFGFGKEQLEGRELTAWAQQMANMNQAAGTVSKDVIRKFMSAGNTLEEVEASMSPEIFNAFAQQIAEADSVYQRLVAEIAARAEKENWTSEQFRDAVGEARDAALERATSDLRVAQENDRFKKDVTEVRQRLESTGVSILEKIIGNTPEANQKYARSLQMATELMKGNTNATKAEEKRMYDEAYNRAGGGLEGRRAGEEAAAQVRQETTRAGMELLSLGDSTDQNVRNAKAQLLESQLQGMGVDTQNDPFSKAVLDSLRATDPSLELLGQIQENTKAAADALKNQAMDAGLLGLENAYGPQTLEEYRESVGGERRTGFGGIYDENKGNIWTGIGILGAGGVAAAFPGVRRSVRGGYRRGKQAFSDAWASDEELERRRAARAAEAEGGDGASRPRPTDTPDGKRKRSWWPFGGGDSGSGGSSSSGKKPKPSSPKGPRSPRGKPRMAGIDFIGYGAAALSGVGLASAFGGESGSDADMEALPADAEVIGLLAAIEANTRACCMGGGDGGGGAGRGGAFSVSAESSSQRTKPTEEEPARTLTDALADEFTTGNGLQYFVQSVIADAIGVRAAVGEIRSKARPATAAADEASAARPKVRPSTAAADEASAARPKLKPPTAAAEEATVARPRPAVDSSSRRYTSSGRAYVDETGQSYSTRTGQRLSGAADTSVVRNIEAQQPKPIVGVDGEAAVTTKSGSYRKGDRYYRKDGTEITSGQGKAAVQRALDAQAKRTAPKPLPGPETTRKPLPVPETTPKPPPAPETTRKPPPAPPPPPSEVTSTRPKLPSLPVVEPEPSRMPGIAGIANVGAQGVGAFLSGRAAMDQYSAGNTVYALNESAGVGAGLFNVLGAFGGGGGYNAFGAVGDTFSLARNLGRQFSGQSIEQGTVVQDAISTVADAAQITAQVPSIQTAGRTTVNAIKNAPQTAKSTIDIVKNLPSFIKQAPDLIKQAPQLIKNIPSLFSGASSPAVSAAASVGGNVFSQTAAKAVPFLGAALGGAFGYMAPTEQSANENDPYAQALSNRTSTANALYGALGAGPTTMGDVGAQSSLGWALGAEQGGMLDKQLGNWSQLGMGSLQNWWAGPYAPLVTATAMTGQELRALQTDQANEQAAIEKTARMEESYVEQQSKANEAYKDMSPEEILAIKNIATFETQRDKYQKLVDSGKGDEREWKSMPTKYIDDQGVERMTEGVKETMTNQEKLDQLNKRVGEGYVRLSKSKPAEPSGFFSFFGKKKPEKSPGEIRAMEKAIIEEEKKKLVGTYTTDVDTKPVDMSQTRLSSEAMPPSGITAAASPQTVVPELLAQSLSSVPGSDVGREGAFSSIPDLTESANRRMEASSGPAGRPINPAAAAVIDSVLERTRERRGGEAFSIPPEATGITGSARREIATGLAPMHPAAAAVIDSALERTRAETGPAGRTTFDTAGDFLTERMGFGSGSVTASNQEYRQNMFSVEPGLSTENFEPSQLMQLLSPGVAAQFGAPVVDLGPAPSNVSLPGGTTSDSSEITNALFGQSPGRNAILQQLATAPFSSLLSGFSPMLGLASSYFGAGGDGQTALSTVGEQLAGSDLSGLAVSNLLSGFSPMLGLASSYFGAGGDGQTALSTAGEQLAGSDLSGLAVSNLLSGFNPLLGLAATAFGFGQPAQPVSATQANANKPPVQAQGMLTGTSLTPEEQNVMRQAPNLYNGGIVTSGTIDAALGQYQQQKQALEAARTTAVGNQAANVVQDMIPGEEKGAMVANQSVSAVQSGVSTNVAEPVIAQMSDAGIQFGQSFMGAITEPLNGLFGNFAQLLTEVQSKIPDVINMQGQHKLEIIINGADALKSINDDLKEMVETEIKAKIKNINNNLEGGLGLNP